MDGKKGMDVWGGLKFLGCGSAFNPMLGNTSAFVEDGSRLILLDCGETVFSHLFRLGVFEQYQEFYVIITHTHSDHVGSLASLISYCYFVKKKRVHVIHPNRSVVRLLRQMGVGEEIYRWQKPSSLILGHISLEEIPVRHAEDIKCYGYILTLYGQRIYYSGDSYEIPDRIMEELKNGSLDRVYQDVTEYPSSHLSHYPIQLLAERVPKAFRKKVYCMHFTTSFSEKIRELGFRVVEAADMEGGGLDVSDGFTYPYKREQLLRESRS